MQQSVKIIDFFAHDVLDFSVLHKESQNFKKQTSIFDIRSAVAEILEIQMDKANMKEITIQS